ncbi:MAG: hypothetical protein ACREJ3_02515 [Polyangiaceae bacterium]
MATVFVSDPTAEAERVAHALRAGGYAVIDVPLSMLVARVAVQRPRVVLVDADSDGAIEVVGTMRDLPGAEGIHVLFAALPGAAMMSPEEALARGSGGLFVRPVDIPALVLKVDALTGGPRSAPVIAQPTPPGELSSAKSVLPPASMRGVADSPSQSLRPHQRLNPSESSTSGPTSLRVGVGTAPVSPELQQLLDEAELRVIVRADNATVMLSPEEEIEAVLPAELLASLDEPLDGTDDDVASPAAPHAAAAARRDVTNHGGAPRTTGASSAGSGATPGEGMEGLAGRERSGSGPEGMRGGTHAGPDGSGISTTGDSATGERFDGSSVRTPSLDSGGGPGAVPIPRDREPSRGSVSLPTVGGAFPPVFGNGEAASLVARAIVSRSSGSLCFTTGVVERRVVLREGDFVTAVSNEDSESLVAFLGTRGDLPRETVRKAGSNLPGFGRHAGAALVARGFLRQEQMWPALRAHAEWVLGRLLSAEGGRLAIEAPPPGRLAGEPSVFGGSTGAEIFVDLLRRSVSPEDAVEWLGGEGARIGQGPASDLLDECALGAAHRERLRAAPGKTLGEMLEGGLDPELATVIYALSLLHIIDVLPAIHPGSRAEPDVSAGVAALDADAIRERVRARSQLVDDGDYFAVLGVARDATGYEVRRAFLELRRAFEPSRMLTPEVADLADDVRRISGVLEEAYEVLRDPARRDRYRRAIDTVPAD